MPAEAESKIEFSPVAVGDLPLIGIWLTRPHIRQWWGEPETELGYISDMVADKDTTRPFLFRINGEPLGYIQVWSLGDPQNEIWIKDNPWLAEFPAAAVGVDLSIGDPDRLSQGLGTRVLKAFIAMLLKEGRKTILIDPHPDNIRAIRSYEKVGFRPVPHLLGRTGNCLLMRYEQGSTPGPDA